MTKPKSPTYYQPPGLDDPNFQLEPGEDGQYRMELYGPDGDYHPLCTPIMLKAHAFSAANKSWGWLVRFATAEGEWLDAYLPMMGTDDKLKAAIKDMEGYGFSIYPPPDFWPSEDMMLNTFDEMLRSWVTTACAVFAVNEAKTIDPEPDEISVLNYPIPLILSGGSVDD